MQHEGRVGGRRRIRRHPSNVLDLAVRQIPSLHLRIHRFPTATCPDRLTWHWPRPPSESDGFASARTEFGGLACKASVLSCSCLSAKDRDRATFASFAKAIPTAQRFTARWSKVGASSLPAFQIQARGLLRNGLSFSRVLQSGTLFRTLAKQAQSTRPGAQTN